MSVVESMMRVRMTSTPTMMRMRSDDTDTDDDTDVANEDDGVLKSNPSECDVCDSSSVPRHV